MTQWLLFIGLIVVPFAHIEHYVDMNFIKEYVALGIAMAITFQAAYSRGIKLIENKWAMFAIASMLASTAFVPPSGLVLGKVESGQTGFAYTNINIENLWNYKPIFVAMLYLLMASAIAQNFIDIKKVAKIISWVGFIMSLTVIAEHFGFQEFWRVQNDGELGAMRHPELMGFLAQYTLASAFICMCLPGALFCRKYFFAVVMSIAIFLLSSHFGYMSAIFAWVIWILSKNGFLRALMPSLIGIGILIFLYIFWNQDDGRFGLWSMIWHDMTNPLFGNRLAESQGFFGYGAGSYGVFFPIIHHSPWWKAHNDYFEFLFNNGIAGILLMLSAIGSFMYLCYRNYSEEVWFCLSTFLVTCTLAVGTFIWQTGWGEFYTAAIVGAGYSALRRMEGIK